jgi:hypothetical protein
MQLKFMQKNEIIHTCFSSSKFGIFLTLTENSTGTGFPAKKRWTMDPFISVAEFGVGEITIEQGWRLMNSVIRRHDVVDAARLLASDHRHQRAEKHTGHSNGGEQPSEITNRTQSFLHLVPKMDLRFRARRKWFFRRLQT